MNASLALESASLARLGLVRELLELIAAARRMQEPLTTAAGLRAALALVVRLLELVGLDPAWRTRLEAILADERVFRIVLALVQGIFGTLDDASDPAFRVRAEAAEAVVLDTQSLVDWLPVVVQLVRLWRLLRGTP